MKDGHNNGHCYSYQDSRVVTHNLYKLKKPNIFEEKFYHTTFIKYYEFFFHHVVEMLIHTHLDMAVFVKSQYLKHVQKCWKNGDY